MGSLLKKDSLCWYDSTTNFFICYYERSETWSKTNGSWHSFKCILYPKLLAENSNESMSKERS